jgi:hypothetical protein
VLSARSAMASSTASSGRTARPTGRLPRSSMRSVSR